MGISVSAGTAIILIGAFVALGVIVPGFLDAHDRISTANEVREDRELTRMHTALTIESVDETEDELELTVVNDGSTELSLSSISVIVENEYVPIAASMIDPAGTEDTETDLWLPGEDVVLTVQKPEGATSVQVVTGVGVTDRKELGGEQ